MTFKNTILITSACCFTLLLFSLPLHGQEAPQLIIENDRAVAVSFAADGNADSWRFFKEKSTQPLAGRSELNNGTLIFRPVVAFQPGLTYLVENNGSITHTFATPNSEQTKPAVVNIYPTSDTLPANLLKFYVQFSEPMAEGDPYDSIHLIDSAGDTLRDVFLKQLPALWNRSRTILSLWLDPGRIKRDLNLNKKRGMPLAESQSYRLVVNTTLKNSSGISLQSNKQKKFSVVSADRQKPDPESWNIKIPEKGSKEPLIVYFNETMDYLSTVGRLVLLINKKPVRGEPTFKNEERAWVFTPSQSWPGGNYTLRADARMEDWAGNNLNRLFDRNMKSKAPAEQNFHTVGFTIR